MYILGDVTKLLKCNNKNNNFMLFKVIRINLYFNIIFIIIIYYIIICIIAYLQLGSVG